MKNCILTLLLTMFFHGITKAQGISNTLPVGDKAPPIEIYKWIKGSAVTGFKKGQVYLVDFGATWCVPCGRAIFHLNKLQNEFGSRLTVVSVFVMEPRMDSTDDFYVQNVKKYVAGQGSNMQYGVAVDDPGGTMEKTWLRARNLMGIPWAFIIDKDGMIAWLGDPSNPILEKKIQYVLDPSYSLSQAIEQERIENKDKGPWVETLKPLFIDGNGGEGKDFLYRSILTKYKGEQAGNIDFVYSTHWATDYEKDQHYAGMVQQIGVPLSKLYYLAYADTMGNTIYGRMLPSDEFPDTVKYPTMVDRYGKYWYTPILEVRDTVPFQFSFHAMANRYNYSLIVPDEKASAKFLQDAMKRDLKTYFGYDVTVEERMMPCWNLVATEKAKTLLRTKTPGGKFKDVQLNDTLYWHSNAVMKDIMTQNIISVYSFGFASFGKRPRIEAPFFDETGIKGEFDYELSVRQFKEMSAGNWNVLMEFLHKLGLDLVKGQRLMRVVVIRDPK